MYPLLVVLGSLLLASLTGCALPAAAPLTDAPHVIYVVRRELHTGVAIAAEAWPDRDWSLLAEFADARYLEFGRGDAAYYQALQKTLGMTLGAVFLPNRSVIEVLAQPDLERMATHDYDIVAVPVTQQQLDALGESITRSFTASSPIPTGTRWTSVAGETRFYDARGSFHLFRLCNRWTAEQLRAAGCSLSPWPVFLSSQVMRAARRCEAARRDDALHP
jgi:hypothetical protein